MDRSSPLFFSKKVYFLTRVFGILPFFFHIFIVFLKKNSKHLIYLSLPPNDGSRRNLTVSQSVFLLNWAYFIM